MSRTSEIPFYFYRNELTSAIYIVYGSYLVATLQYDGDHFAIMLSNMDNINETAKLVEGLPMMTPETIKNIIQHEKTTDFIQKNVSILAELCKELDLDQNWAMNLNKEVDADFNSRKSRGGKGRPIPSPIVNKPSNKIQPIFQQKIDSQLALLKLNLRIKNTP